jgi:hypothetical protein
MMSERTKRSILLVVFLGLLSVPLLVRKFAGHSAASQMRMSDAMAMKRYGFYLTEVSKAAGVNFVHQGPKLDPKLDAIMPEVASMGASVSIVDFDRDGWPDIYVTDIATCTMAHSRMWRGRWALPT